VAHLYIFQNEAGRYYVGSTSDLDKRLKHHVGGYTPSTKRLGKIELFFSQKFTSLEKARGVERWLKKMKRRDYIERIIKDGYIKRMRF